MNFTLEAPENKVEFYVRQGFRAVGEPEESVVSEIRVQRMKCVVESRSLDLLQRGQVAASVLCPHARVVIFA